MRGDEFCGRFWFLGWGSWELFGPLQILTGAQSIALTQKWATETNQKSGREGQAARLHETYAISQVNGRINGVKSSQGSFPAYNIVLFFCKYSFLLFLLYQASHSKGNREQEENQEAGRSYEYRIWAQSDLTCIGEVLPDASLWMACSRVDITLFQRSCP